jgi:hypothetical protein
MLKYMSVPDDERNVETCNTVLWRNIILSCVAANRTLCTVSTDGGVGHTLTETKNYLKYQITTFITAA